MTVAHARTFDVAEDVGAEERHDQHGHGQRTVGQQLPLAGVQKRPVHVHNVSLHVILAGDKTVCFLRANVGQLSRVWISCCVLLGS